MTITELRKLIDHYEIPRTLKDKKETTGKKELEEMFFHTGDPILEQVMELRSLDTNINNYIPNWKPQSDGRVRTTWGFTAPSRQIDSRQPNVLNCSKHTEIGQLFRRAVEAPTGYVFSEYDKRSFHVASMGFNANDAGYIRFSQLDPHSIFTSYIMPRDWGPPIDLAWSDADILARCKEIKARCKAEKAKDPIHGIDIRQSQAKPTVLGNQLGLGARKLWWQNRRFIPNIAAAEGYQKTLSGLFNKPEIWKKAIRRQAHDAKYLRNPWGFIQWFYDVYNYTWNKKYYKWDERHGKDHDKVPAFRVQGDAFGMIHQEIIDMEQVEICEEFNFLVTIHDSAMFMPEKGKIDKCHEAVCKYMRRPCSRLVNEATGPKGLFVDIEASVGRNWGTVDNDKRYWADGNKEGMAEVKI